MNKDNVYMLTAGWGGVDMPRCLDADVRIWAVRKTSLTLREIGSRLAGITQGAIPMRVTLFCADP